MIPNAKLIIAGEGRLRDKLQSMIQNASLQNKIMLVGYKSNITEYLQVANVFVSSSKSEGISNSILDAGYCKLPVIASAVGGTTEIIDHDIDGLLFDYNNQNEFLSCIKTIHDDVERATRLGENLHNKVISKFHPDFMIKNIKKKAMSVKKVKGLNDVRAHYVGNYVHVEVHIEVNKNMTIHEAHEIGKQVEKAVQSLPSINKAFVHIDPV